MTAATSRHMAAFDWAVVAALVLALPLIVPFLGPGLPVTADGELHVHRITSAVINIQAGHLWPRWTPYLYQGFGYPLHNYHPPGTYILGALMVLPTGLDAVTIFKVLQVGFTLLYPLGAYYFARTFAGRPGALVAAAAYTYAPFRLLELWVQMDLPQFAAMSLFPWLLWAIARGVERRRPIWIIAIGISLAGIVLTHHASTFFFAPVVGLYVLLMTLSQYRSGGRKGALQAFGIAVSGLGLGLLLSAAYWLPALAELGYIQIHSIQDAMFDVRANFLPLRQLVSLGGPIDRAMLNWGYLYGPAGPRAGWPQVLAAVIGLLSLVPALRCDRRLKLSVIAGATAVIVFLCLVTPMSEPIWTSVPLARLLQFPWRLLGVVAVAAIPGAAALPALATSRWQHAVAGGAIGVFFAAALPSLYTPLSMQQIDMPTPATTIKLEQRTGNVGLTSSSEYLPRWTSERPLSVLKTVDYNVAEWRVWIDDAGLPSGATVQALPARSPGLSRFRLETPTDFTLTFHQMYFPGWRVAIDGQDAELGQSKPYGLITVEAPAGTHEIAIWYGGTALQQTANLLSTVGLIGSVIALALLFSRRRTSPDTRRPTLPDNRLARRVVVFFAGFVVINQLVIVPHTTLFRPRSDPASPPVQHRVQEVFSETIELLGFDLDTQVATPGQAIYLQLYWRLLKPTDQSLRAAVRLTSIDGSQSWGQVESFNLGGTNTRNWPTDQYAVDRYQLTITSDAPPYVGHLRVAVFPFGPTIDYLKTANGKADVVLTDFRILGDRQIISDSEIVKSDITFRSMVKLLGTFQERAASNRQCITLRWRVVSAPTSEYAVMLHLRDADGKMLAAADGPPLDGLYPTHQWQTGQILDDRHCFTAEVGVLSVAVGLYSREDGQRLPAVSPSGERLVDDSVIIPLDFQERAG